MRVRSWKGRAAAPLMAAILVILVGGACGGQRTAPAPVEDAPPIATAAIASAAAADAGLASMPHGNHNPKYGGVVLMNGDMHFEVVLRRAGEYQIYFSDATRTELPASVASNVTITVTRAKGGPEPVALRIDDSGESWTGAGHAVDDPDAVARIAYTVQGKPYWIDLPFSAAGSVPSP